MDAPPIPPTDEAAAPVETGLWTRLTNVYAAPGEVFDEIKGRPPRTSNWLVPALIACLMVAVYNIALFSQEGIVRELREMQERGMRKQVAAGKMPKATADQAIQMMEKFMTPAVLMVFGSLFGAPTVFGEIFGIALALWLASSLIFKAQVPYLKMVEVSGLTMMVDALQKGVRALLGVWKGSMLATAGPILLVETPSTANRTHLILASLDVTDFWWLALLALGLSKLSGASFWKAAALTFAAWYGIKAVMIMLAPVR
jgi:hypothetical protein